MAELVDGETRWANVTLAGRAALLKQVLTLMTTHAEEWVATAAAIKGGLGIVVAAFMQDPRKEILPMRGLFTQTIALRLRSRDEVTMVLGDSLADGAPAHRINPDEPGTGYVIAEDGSTMRVRADYWPDSLIRSVAKEYGFARQRPADPAGN